MEEIKLSFTQFMKYTVLNPNKRLQYVHEVKHSRYQDGYDYWAIARNGIVKFHRDGLDESFLDSLVMKAPVDHRHNYQLAITNYKGFLKRNRKIEWFDTSKKYFHFENVHINVGAELGLVLNGTPHFIKLYFTDDGINQKLDNGKAQLMLYLLRQAIHEQIDDGDRLAIINIKNSASIIRDKEIDEFTEKNLILNLKNFIEAWNMV